MTRQLRSVLVGAGKVGLSYADDPVMARHYPYAAHAQVLKDHPAFEWGAVVDRSAEAAAAARERFGVPLASPSIEGCRDYAPEVAVLATPPDERLEIISALPGLRAVLVEKPLGTDEAASSRFLDECEARGILVQVNLWRRADKVFRGLADTLEQRIGPVQAGFAVYGNGLANNGTHMVDFLRMLLGEVESVQALDRVRPAHGPLAGDIHVPFAMRMRSGPTVQAAALDFRAYRENGVDIWGERGRLTILQEGLHIALAPLTGNRAMSGEQEVASDSPELIAPSVGTAFYEMYDNLAEAIFEGVPLVSPGASALRSAAVVDAVLRSAAASGARVELPA